MGEKFEMKRLAPSTSLHIYSGFRAFIIRMNLLFYAIRKYLFRKKEFPLFILNPFKNGLLKTIMIKQKLKLHKIIQYNDTYFCSMEKPHWPSKAWDYMAAKGGLNLAAAGTSYKAHIDLAILAITQKCYYKCKHCYEHNNIQIEDSVSINNWMKVISDFQKIGTGVIVLSGGEPMLRYEQILKLLESADKTLSDFHIYTSGYGVTRQKVSALKKAGLIAAGIGLDDIDPERQDALRGFKGAYREAVNAIHCFNSEGIFTYINTCLTKELVRSGDLWKLIEDAKKMNVGVIRLLEPKPCGGYLLENIDNLFNKDDRRIVTNFFLEVNKSRKYRNYPIVSYLNYLESPERLGCIMGGLYHLHIDSRGNVNPCVFLPVSFGNITENDFPYIYKKMRDAIPYSLHKKCPSLYLSESIREEKRQGKSLPIVYEDLKNDWQEMYK